MALTAYALKLAEAAGHPMAEHSRAVAELAGEVAMELGLDEAARQEVELAALLHDVGKVALMEEILYKPDGLTREELDRVRRHPVRSQEMLERGGEVFRPIGRIVRSCHERWDGTGYPDGLSGEEIPLPARIIFCCAAYEAMTSDRPYSEAVSHTRAVQELWAHSGSQFDPEVVGALLRAVPRRPAPAAVPELEQERAKGADFSRAGVGGEAGGSG